nr:uncharacterized protein CTRU02_14234 [Colletotrichum truncatum]KAF6782457.1 hypothetical protein CTRU02_14234 [Colletotrichum truncatum]
MGLLIAPYNSAMRLGQGFNSYTQKICIDDAVIIDPGRRLNVLTNDGSTIVDLREGMKGGSSNDESKPKALAESTEKPLLTPNRDGDSAPETRQAQKSRCWLMLLRIKPAMPPVDNDLKAEAPQKVTSAASNGPGEV